MQAYTIVECPRHYHNSFTLEWCVVSNYNGSLMAKFALLIDAMDYVAHASLWHVIDWSN